MCIELLLLTTVVACKCQVPLLKPFREPLLFFSRIQLTFLHRILFGILILSTVGSWNQKLLTSGTTLLLMVSFLSANQKYFYPVLYDMYIILCLRILAVYEVSTFFFNKEMLINQKCPHMKCKICKFLVLSNLALKVLLLLSGFIFSFFVGVRFCLTAMLYLIMGFFLPKSSGVKLQESIVDDCPLHSKQKSGDCRQQS